MDKDTTFSLARLFQDHMVLQRAKPLPIWGIGTPGDTVNVRFKEQSKETLVAPDGNWHMELEPEATDCKPANLEVTNGDGKEITVTDVLVGDVYFFSGQSNAAMGLKGCEGGEEAAAKANHPYIRFFSVKHKEFDRTEWVVCTPKTAPDISGFAFYSARAINRDTSVPVGAIICALGGTMLNTWLSPEGIRTNPQLRNEIMKAREKELHLTYLREHYADRWRAYVTEETEGDEHKALEKVIGARGTAPSINFKNYGLDQIAPYAVRGLAWYQGESNAYCFPIAARYHEELTTLIYDWRRLWGRNTLPFFVVQLPQYPQSTRNEYPPEINPWSMVMEAQDRVQHELPEVYTVITIDLGLENNIHPKKKGPIGERLSLLARKHLYNENVEADAPMLRDWAVTGNQAELHLGHVGTGLQVHDMPDSAASAEQLEGFTIAGEDRCFYRAHAEIVTPDTVVCHAPEVSVPAAVRYAMHEGCLHNLYNSEGLPAGPFRTDDWGYDLVDTRKRQTVAKRVDTPPELEDSVWEEIDLCDDFRIFHSWRAPACSTAAQFAWDEKALYVRVIAEQPAEDRVANATDHDPEKIWQDDNVELILDPDRDKERYLRISLNPKGTMLAFTGYNEYSEESPRLLQQSMLGLQRDLKDTTLGNVKVHTDSDSTAWKMLLMIPWQDLGVTVPQTGIEMGLQVVRNIAETHESSVWTLTGRDHNTSAMMPVNATNGKRLYHVPSRFGRLTLQ